jgi:hypothetical protein
MVSFLIFLKGELPRTGDLKPLLSVGSGLRTPPLAQLAQYASYTKGTVPQIQWVGRIYYRE